MNRLTALFVKAAVLYGLIGFTIGLVMGATGNFTLRSAHSHLNLLGWTSLAIYAGFYQIAPKASELLASTVHFYLAILGTAVITIGVGLISYGVGAPGAAIAGIGSVITLASFLVFTYIVFKTT